MTDQRLLDEYLALPYTIILRKDGDGDVVARVEELRGCQAHGETAGEALARLAESQGAWIEMALAAGETIPKPDVRDESVLPSGKWLQRVPRTLHLRLAERAKEEGVSLNHLVATMLSEALAARSVGSIESASKTELRKGLTDWEETWEGAPASAWDVSHPAGTWAEGLTLYFVRHLAGLRRSPTRGKAKATSRVDFIGDEESSAHAH
jgi:predicted RNase H-like HicB family nuclease